MIYVERETDITRMQSVTLPWCAYALGYLFSGGLLRRDAASQKNIAVLVFAFFMHFWTTKYAN